MVSNMSESVLSLQEVCKIYQLGEQELYALCDVTLDIHEGEFVAVIGPSGSGKSTFLHMASLLDKPSKGHIFIRGTETTNFSEEERAKLRNEEIGFVFQQFNLLPKTSALENVALPLVYANTPKGERDARAKEILEKVGLGDRLNNTPAQLSGGQQQRVAIARALVNEPAIIFADEPTGNLDTQSGEEIKQILQELHHEGKTIVMVTHEQEMAEIAQRTIVLRDGKVESDTKNGKADHAD